MPTDQELLSLMRSIEESVPELATAAPTQPGAEAATDEDTQGMSEATLSLLRDLVSANADATATAAAEKVNPQPALQQLEAAISSEAPIDPQRFDASGEAPAPAVSVLDALKEDLRGDEKFSPKAYPDADNVSIGYGLFLGRGDADDLLKSVGYTSEDIKKLRSGEMEIGLDQAEQLLDVTAKQSLAEAKRNFPNFDQFLPGEQRAISNMYYQLKIKPHTWPELRKAAVDMNREAMVYHMSTDGKGGPSKWAKDTPKRYADVLGRFVNARATPAGVAAEGDVRAVPDDVPVDVPAPRTGPKDVPWDVPAPRPPGERTIGDESTALSDVLDWAGEVYRGLRYSKDYNASRQAIELAQFTDKKALQPEFDSEGTFLGWKHETEEERVRRREIEREAAMRADKADSIGKSAQIAADTLSVLGDPLALLVPALKGANLFGRLTRMGAAGAAYSSGAETLRQINDESEIDVAAIAEMAGWGGIGGAVGGEVMHQAVKFGGLLLKQAAENIGESLTERAALAADPRAVKVTDAAIAKEASAIVDRLEARFAAYKDKGLNDGAALNRAVTEEGMLPQAGNAKLFRKVMREEGVSPEQLPKIFKQAGRKPILDPEAHSAFTPKSGLAEGGFMRSTSVGRFLDEYIGVLSTRIANISPAVAKRLQRFEFDTLQRQAAYSKEAEEFMMLIRPKPLVGFKQGLSKNVTERVGWALSNGDYGEAVQQLLKIKDVKLRTKALKSLERIKPLLDKVFFEMRRSGVDISYLPEHFPRKVKDYKAMMKDLGHEVSSAVEKRIDKINTERAAKNLPKLNDVEMENVLNQMLRARSAMGAGLGQSKIGIAQARTIEHIPFHVYKKHYEPAHRVLAQYLNTAAHTIEKSKLFGKHVDLSDVANPNAKDMLSKWLMKEMRDGELTFGEMTDLIKMLQARFAGGEAEAHKGLQHAKNIFYMATLGQPTSTLTQLTDIGLSTYKNGVRNTIKALLPGLGNKMTNKDIGLETVAAEMSSTLSTARALRRVFGITWFRAADGLGKSTALTGAVHKFANQVRTVKGAAEFARQYGHAFKDREQVKGVIMALRRGEFTDDVKFLATTELMGLQPVTMSEMPEAYLRSPNGRIFYMLKTFAIKQADIMRRDIAQQIEKKNYKLAARNAVKMFTFYSLAGMGVEGAKNFVLGRETNMSDLVVSSLMKNFVISEYVIKKGADGKIGEALGNLIMPPLNILDHIGGDLADFGKKFNSLQDIPIGGRMAYNLWGGGFEKTMAAQKKSAFQNAELKKTDAELKEFMDALDDELGDW